MASYDGLHLYNTLTNRKEPFAPRVGEQVTMYVCGPTVYDECHMGHARSYVVFDVIARYMRWLGLGVQIAINFTDVEERITERAEALGVDPLTFAGEKISEYFEVMDSLGILRADDYPRVSQFVPQMIDVVERLMELGYAYRLGDRIFMDVERAGGYGELLHSPPEEALVQEGSSDLEPGRRSPFDFELWDGTVDKDPTWDSPWGRGRIGWHVECYVMSKTLGFPIDIKGGGLDLIFPHHESTKLLASALGEQLARFYVHNAFMTFRERKMSKSDGIFVPIRTALGKHSPDALRYFILSEHYRATLPYSDSTLRTSREKLAAIRDFVGYLKRSATKGDLGQDDDALAELAETLRVEFMASMNDDINTPSVLRSVERFVRESEGREFGQRARKKVLDVFAEIGSVLGFDW